MPKGALGRRTRELTVWRFDWVGLTSEKLEMGRVSGMPDAQKLVGEHGIVVPALPEAAEHLPQEMAPSKAAMGPPYSGKQRSRKERFSSRIRSKQRSVRLLRATFDVNFPGGADRATNLQRQTKR